MSQQAIICGILLLLQAWASNGIPISNNNGYIHMDANSPELMAVYESQFIPLYGTPSIKLPLNLTESVRASGDISIEIRLKIVAVENYPHVLLAPTDKEPPGGAYRSPHLYYGNDSRIYFVFFDGISPAKSNPVNLTDGEWHMISAVLSKTGNYYAIYVDGVSQTDGPRTPGVYSWVPEESPPPHVHLIGNGGCKSILPDWPGTRDDIAECFFNGYIDEFRIWSKTLTLEDVRQNLNANLFGDEPNLAYVLPFDALSEDFPEYFVGGTPGNRSYLVRRENGGGYDQTMIFVPSNVTVDIIFVDLNETHAQTTLIYYNPLETSEFHPFGRNNYFMVNGTRVLDLGQPQVIVSGTSNFSLVWLKDNITSFSYKLGNVAARSMIITTIVPQPISEPVTPVAEPVAAVVIVPGPDPAVSDNTVAIAVGVTVPLVVVGAGAAVLAMFLIQRKKKAEKEKTFAEKQGAIIQSRKIEILNKIGSGSFGDVWRGLWKGKEVAVKEVKSGADSSFLNEIKIMAKLPPHDNVMEVYGAIIDADSPSLVLEFCGGGSLDFLLYDTEEPISEDKMIKLALGIARGMEHLHKYNIVHRDLAARNVLLTTAHVPKICDFGMSRTVAERNASNKTKNDMGPIRWMAPEALTGEYSTKTDIWSYGIVLSEITSRTEPHTDVDPLKIALQIRDEKMTPKISATCPPAIADIMKMCWNPNPSERPEFSKVVELLEIVAHKK